MKKEQNNSKSITERKSNVTKVIDITNSKNTLKITDFQCAMHKIAREISLKICNKIAKSTEKIPEESYQLVLEQILKSLEIHAEINIKFNYWEPK